MLLKIFHWIEDFIITSWWVVLFLLGCYFFYEHGLLKRDQDFTKLSAQYLDLQREKKLALTQQEDLLLQINSQSDPAWMELTLIKGLGLVGEGQTKILFTDDAVTQ